MSQQQTDEIAITVEVTVDASLDAAFAAFTERAQEWWPAMYHLGAEELADLKIDPDRGRWFEVGTEGTTCDWGRVLAWDPPKHVALSWQLTPAFGPEPDPDRASRIDVHLVTDGPDRTNVTLVHSGFERHGEDWESMREGVDGETGWPGILATYARVASG